MSVTALNSIDIEFAAGEFTAIMGPSGSGKSTLLHCLAGLDRLSKGHAYIGDVELGTLSDRELTLLRRSKIGFVFQSYNLIPTLTAAENITLPLRLEKRPANQDVLDQVVSVIALGDRLTHRPSELSGGQQQRVAVARALVSEPDLIVADEPTGNLDSRSGTQILSYLRQAVTTGGQSLVMVTHDSSAAAWADRVAFIVDGRLRHEIENPDVDNIVDVMMRLGGSQ